MDSSRLKNCFKEICPYWSDLDMLNDEEMFLDAVRYESRLTKNPNIIIKNIYHYLLKKDIAEKKLVKITSNYKIVCLRLLKEVIWKHLEESNKNIIKIYQGMYKENQTYYDNFHFDDFYRQQQIHPFELDDCIDDLKKFYQQQLDLNMTLKQFCNDIMAGNFTNKIDHWTGLILQSFKKTNNLDRILTIKKIIDKFPLISCHFSVYRCIQLPNLLTINRFIPHLLPTSWSFYQGYPEYWCLPENYKLNKYILVVSLQNNKNIIFNSQNQSQYEVILMPCVLQVKNIVDMYVVKYVHCSVEFDDAVQIKKNFT
jgi:hypothetical protein